MIGVRASVKWLLTAVAVLSGVSLAAQVLPGEEGILERGRRLPGEVSVEALVDSVARWGRTEREKVIVLAGWFREYMAIDVGKFLTGGPNGDYRDVLKERKGICGDFTGLFGELCNRLGIENERVEGYVVEDGRERGETCLRTNHVWNAVRVAGEWWHVDMMWAVGALGRDAGGEWVFKRHWNPEYVLTRGEQFLTTHMPADPAWQLTDRLYPMNAFIEGNLADGERGDYYNYMDSITVFRRLPRNERQMLFARRANRFNPRNKEVMAVTYYNEAVFLLNYNRKTRAVLNRAREYFRIAEEYARDLPGVKESIDEGLRNVEALIK